MRKRFDNRIAFLRQFFFFTFYWWYYFESFYLHFYWQNCNFIFVWFFCFFCLLCWTGRRHFHRQQKRDKKTIFVIDSHRSTFIHDNVLIFFFYFLCSCLCVGLLVVGQCRQQNNDQYDTTHYINVGAEMHAN